PSKRFKLSILPVFEHKSLKNEHSWIKGTRTCFGSSFRIRRGRSCCIKI
ncbi:hypothetical protein LINPERPRIM_LOCUS36662, partial [Linum perenne]